jgi:IS5 family transposase
MHRFAGLKLNEDPIPDETTILKFRRFLWSSTVWRRKFLTRSMLTVTEREGSVASAEYDRG